LTDSIEDCVLDIFRQHPRDAFTAQGIKSYVYGHWPDNSKTAEKNIASTLNRLSSNNGPLNFIVPTPNNEPLYTLKVN